MLKPSPSSVSKMGNSLIRTRFSSSRLHSISGTTQGIDMVPNNFQIELKGLPIATSQFTGVKHVTHRETGWENSGSKETGLEYDGFIVYVHFLNLGNLELELFPIHRKIKNVPNHRPIYIYSSLAPVFLYPAVPQLFSKSLEVLEPYF